MNTNLNMVNELLANDQSKVDCIIPVFNEEDRILRVIKELSQIALINKIICVDDGSTDNTREQLLMAHENTNGRVEVVLLDKNLGKSDAVRQGLKKVKTKHVLLFDADVRNLSMSELEPGIRIYLEEERIKMLLFCEINELMISRILRFNVVFSGNRLLSTKDLKRVFALEPERFQLETAINHYMSQFSKSVFYYNYSALNTHKVKKMGYVNGLKQELSMCKDVIEFAGPLEVIKQISNFARQEYQS